ACSHRPQADTPLDIRPLELAAAAGSSSPNLSTFHDGAIVSWVETVAVENAGSRATLKFAERTDGAWTAPRSVASGSDWFINPADVPSSVPLHNPTIPPHCLPTTN